MTDASASPLGNPIALVRASILLVLTALLTYTWADPDLWGHVLFGGDILRERSIPRIDPYAFTSDQTWVNHEWLAEVAMFGAYAVGGGIGLVGLKVLLAFGAMALVVATLRRLQISPVAVDALLGLAVVGSLVRLSTVRPQLFSVVLFVVLLRLLIEVDHGRTRLLAGLPFVMALWVNLHGGWLVGLGTIGLWSAFRFVWPRPGRRRGWIAAAVVGSVLGTLLNPYGVGLWVFLADTVQFGRANIIDWQPMTAFPLLAVPWAIAWSLTLAVVYRNRANLQGAYLALIVGLGVASFRVNRLDVFFALSVVMLLAPEIGRLWSTEQQRVGSAAPTPRLAKLVISSVAWIVILGSSVTALTNLTGVRMSETESPEPGAVLFIQHNDLQGKMLTWFDWGEYAIWHLAPDIQVSMDGRRETIYSNARVQEHLAFYFNRPGALEFPHNLEADYIWLPRELPVVDPLVDDGWRPIFEGDRSIILVDGPHRGLSQPTQAPETRRDFPGP